jgi:hypothetical protein
VATGREAELEAAVLRGVLGMTLVRQCLVASLAPRARLVQGRSRGRGGGSTRGTGESSGRGELGDGRGELDGSAAMAAKERGAMGMTARVLTQSGALLSFTLKMTHPQNATQGQGSEIPLMPSAGSKNYRRWHALLTASHPHGVSVHPSRRQGWPTACQAQ